MHDVITIGTATQDVFLKTSKIKHLDDPKHLKKLGFPTGQAECFALGAKLEVDDLDVNYGGGATNSAVTFSRQGLKTSALVKVGKDEIGQGIIDNLKKEKVDEMVVEDKDDSSGYSVIIIMPSGERSILTYRGAASAFKKREIKVTKLKAKWIYITPSEIPLSTTKWMIGHFKKNGIKVAINPSNYYIKQGIKKLKPILKNVDVVILNREEAAKLTREDYSQVKKIFRKFDKVIDGVAVMTDGKNGAYVSDGRFMYKAGTYKEEKVVDRTGAGDAFGSGFVAGLSQENDIAFALKLASANATSVIEHVGAQTGILDKEGVKAKRFKYLDL
ncbi:MAG: carbohydrate kinase family protein, partial [Candidatus Paceibacterota bacterium]